MASGTLAFLDGIGFSEMLVIAFLSVLVFGGRLPEVMRNLGRSYAKFRQGLHDVSRPLREEIQRATSVSTFPSRPPQAALPAPQPGPDTVPHQEAEPAAALPAAAPAPPTPAAPAVHPHDSPFDEPPPV